METKTQIKKFKFRPNKAIDGAGEPTNGDRAAWAEIGVVSFAYKVYHNKQEQCVHEEVIQDFICDIMHLCDREKLDFDALLAWARFCYEEER